MAVRRFTDTRFKSGYGTPRPADIPVQLIVVHQTGNRKAGATAKMNLDHSFNTKSWSIQRIVDATGIYSAVPLDQIAWHVAEDSIAAAHGIPTSAPGREHRGDVAAVGLEICVNRLRDREGDDRGEKTIPLEGKRFREDRDGWPSLHTSPSRVKKLGPKTYRAAIACLADLIGKFPDAKVVGHGQLDPWTRNTDPFGVLPYGWDAFVEAASRAAQQGGRALRQPVAAPKTGMPAPAPSGLSGRQTEQLSAARRLIDEVLNA